MTLTRRLLLQRAANVGGAAFAYHAMSALGLLAAPQQAPFALRGDGTGVRVLVLGAGLAGLTVAYELGKLGYDCRVFEAKDRPGGRVRTIRGGSRSEEDGPAQVAAFDDGLYFNCGPMRIPHEHRTTLDYCRELDVPVEPFCIQCDSSLLFEQEANGGQQRRMTLRAARADLDGYVSELLSKAIVDDALDLPLSAEDRERLLEYLREAGDLADDRVYRGSSRGGYARWPGVGTETGRVREPFPLSALLASDSGAYLHRELFYQPTLMQVVGGMDRLPRALADRLRRHVEYRAAAEKVLQHEDGVSVVYRDARAREQVAQGDYCVCALPLPALARLELDVAPELRRAIAAVPYASAGKMGLQFKRRFWEEDDAIYGGSSRTDQDISEIVYPSSDYHARKGILVGYYIQREDQAHAMGERTPQERLSLAVEQGARLHPQYPNELDCGFSVAWHRVRWSLGSWARFSEELRRDVYPVLIEPDRRVYLAGDHLTHMNAWMNGAFESARAVASAIHTRAAREIPPDLRGRRKQRA